MAVDVSGLNVLVVDDWASAREAVVMLLRQVGVTRIAVAETGTEALQLIAGTVPPFDVALFDLDMPGDDGLVCIRKIAGFERRPAIILMSGTDAMVLESARHLGEHLGLTILGSLAKPFNAPILIDALVQVRDAPAIRRGRQATGRLEAREVDHALRAHQFDLWFQPQFDLTRGLVRGVEGLLRLDRGNGITLTPDAFIPTAEAAGLMGALTEVVFDRAAHWCATWHREGSEVPVSLNLSKAGLHDLSLPDRAAEICTRHGLLPRNVTLELTESSLATDAAALLDISSRFRLKGFRLSLDDFGTGYASLEELRSLPFHELKIDKQFVQTAGRDLRSRAILENSIALARALGVDVVAEGVETEEMLRLVHSLGCTTIQGYLIAKPMPGANVRAWLESGVAHLNQRSWTMASPGSVPLADTVLRLAHDSAGHLMMVLTLSELMLDDPALGPEQKRDLGRIHEGAREVAAMLKKLQTEARRPA